MLRYSDESHPHSFILLEGSSHPELSHRIAKRIGHPITIVHATIQETGETLLDHIPHSLNGKDVFILQTASGNINDSLMELLMLCYASKTAGARRIIGVVPCLHYAQQSKMRKRSAIPAKLVASMLCNAGLTHLITTDLRDREVQGYFSVPVDNLRCSPFLIQYLSEQGDLNISESVVVARNPNVTKRASSYAERLGTSIAVIHGHMNITEETHELVDGRSSPPPQSISASPPKRVFSNKFILDKQLLPLTLIGNVEDKTAILIDDHLDEVDSLVRAAILLREKGAVRVVVIGTHGIMSSNTPEKLQASPIDEIIVTNTLPQEEHEKKCDKIRVVDISLLMSEAIRRIHFGESMSYLFRNVPMED